MSEILEPGYRLDRYELLCAIARGGMAEVWLARLQGKHGFEKLFAVKTILPQLAADTGFRSMFLDEARIASGIVHPNVAQIIDLGEHEGVLYIVMEWVEGDSLQQIERLLEQKGDKIPPGIMLRAMTDICAGLHAAHELHDRDGVALGVVHRDVSPQNILINVTTGAAKLIDFGVVKARQRLGGDTSAGFMKGKVAFMAPEQPLGGVFDRRVDIWAVGAILYKYFAGVGPYQGETELLLLKQLLNGHAPNPVPDTVPAPIATVIRRALEVKPTDRYSTALEMQTALEGAMIAAGLQASHGAVAAFAAQTLSDRMEGKRRALQNAMRAADSSSGLRAVDGSMSSRAFAVDGGSAGGTPGAAGSASPTTSSLPQSSQSARRSRRGVIATMVFAVVAIAGIFAYVSTAKRVQIATPVVGPPMTSDQVAATRPPPATDTPPAAPSTAQAADLDAAPASDPTRAPRTSPAVRPISARPPVQRPPASTAKVPSTPPSATVSAAAPPPPPSPATAPTRPNLGY